MELNLTVDLCVQNLGSETHDLHTHQRCSVYIILGREKCNVGITIINRGIVYTNYLRLFRGWFYCYTHITRFNSCISTKRYTFTYRYITWKWRSSPASPSCGHHLRPFPHLCRSVAMPWTADCEVPARNSAAPHLDTTGDRQSCHGMKGT